MPGLHEYLYGIRPSGVLVYGINQEPACFQVFMFRVFFHADEYPIYRIELLLVNGIMRINRPINLLTMFFHHSHSGYKTKLLWS